MRTFIVWDKGGEMYRVEAYDSINAMHDVRTSAQGFAFGGIVEVPPISIESNGPSVRVWMGAEPDPRRRERTFPEGGDAADIAGFVRELEEEQFAIARDAMEKGPGPWGYLRMARRDGE